MTTVAITSEVFRWARERAGLSDERLAKSVNTKPYKIRAWEDGREFPNFNQAQKLASALSVPLGYLFLSQPPEIALPITDFRTLPSAGKTIPSLDLQEVLDDALRKRDWYEEWRKQEGFAALDFIGKFSVRSDQDQIVMDMRRELNISEDFASTIGSWDEHLRAFVQKVESSGVLVLQSGIVGNNTKRKLNVEEFRGFALANQYAPLVFINARDPISARIFTLAHELVHLWTGTSGISNPDITPGEKEGLQQIEQLCNQTAAEFLVSTQAFLRQWYKNKEIIDNIQSLARIFRVSAQVILRKGYDLGIIRTDEYFRAYQEVLKAIKPFKSSGGGNFYNTLVSRNSRRFTLDLISAVQSGHLSYYEAAHLINTHPKQLVNVIKLLG
jgi:Zn-dependent peptidase ImmA (M78 family)/DNA-binding XRE family transcriptional regulator